MTDSPSLHLLLDLQESLQNYMPGGKLPKELRGDERAAFLTWNMFALEDELHEAMQETGWKPWATSRHLNVDEMMGEMVDALHFFLNILLVIEADYADKYDATREEFAELFLTLYQVKRQENIARQTEGYDGLAKCRFCGREMKSDPCLCNTSN